jgi:hypothetical protein
MSTLARHAAHESNFARADLFCAATTLIMREAQCRSGKAASVTLKWVTVTHGVTAVIYKVTAVTTQIETTHCARSRNDHKQQNYHQVNAQQEQQ